MRDRGKRELEAYNNNNNGDCFAESFPEFPCKKHPASASSSSGGICAYCLTDRLVQLVCPQCGEQRLNSCCSCTEIFSNPNSSVATDVGRISFLLENDQRGAEIGASRPRNEHRSSSNVDEFAHLRRCNSISVASDMNYTGGHNNYNYNNYSYSSNNNNKGKKSETGKLWKIGRLFRKSKRDKSNNNTIKNNNNNNEESYECNGVSRSRSLCSFRGFYDPEENGGFPVSNSAARASSVSTGNFMLDSAKRSCFSESEARISNFDYYDASNFVGSNKNNNIFSLKETEFVSCDDPAFIDLRLNESSNNNNNNMNMNNNYTTSSSDHPRVPPDLASLRRSGFGMSTKEFGYRGGGGGHDVLGHEMFRNGGGSCRISDVSERELRKCRKSYKVWKWFSRHQHTTSSSSKFDDHDFKS